MINRYEVCKYTFCISVYIYMKHVLALSKQIMTSQYIYCSYSPA